MKRSDLNRAIYRTTPFALGCLTGVLVSVALWLAFGEQWNTRTTLEFLPDLVSMLVALTSLFLAYFVLREQVRTRQAGTDPEVIVHLGKREDSPIMTTLEISNVGAGAAREVKIQIDPIGIAQYREANRIMDRFPAEFHPLRVIKQNESVSFNFGLGYKLLEGEPPSPLKVSVAWSDIDGNLYTNTQVLDPRELHGQRADKPIAARVAKALEGIESHLAKAE